MIRESRTGIERNDPQECTFYNNVYNGGVGGGKGAKMSTTFCASSFFDISLSGI